MGSGSHSRTAVDFQMLRFGLLLAPRTAQERGERTAFGCELLLTSACGALPSLIPGTWEPSKLLKSCHKSTTKSPTVLRHRWSLLISCIAPRAQGSRGKKKILNWGVGGVGRVAGCNRQYIGLYNKGIGVTHYSEGDLSDPNPP